MRFFLSIFLIILLTSCYDPEVDRVYHYNQTLRFTDTRQCETEEMGYCYECGMGLNGYKCDLSFKYSCDGTQPVTVKRVPYTSIRKSGARLESAEDTVISVDGPCE